MKAALVTDFNKPPTLTDVDIPPLSNKQVLVKVLATGLASLVRSRASGKHYSSSGLSLPFVPGIDGVGQLENGDLVYFIVYSGAGTLAQYTNINEEDCFRLPPNADPKMVAAVMNPCASSWLSLRSRIHPKPTFTVLILGVTGASGQLAAQISRALGATLVIGAGRNQNTLDILVKSGKIDCGINLTDDVEFKKAIEKDAANVDIVLDYLWGKPAEITISGIFSRRADSTQRLDWVQIGSIAGPTMNFPSASLRSANFHLCGNGIGPIPKIEVRELLKELVQKVGNGEYQIQIQVHPLQDVDKVWYNNQITERIVFVPW